MTQQTIDHPSFTPSDSIGRANSNPCKYVPAGTGAAYWGPGTRTEPGLLQAWPPVAMGFPRRH
jgi:hypothetical protein